MTGLDETSHVTLLWRSLMQWVGGLGVLLLAIILLPALNVGGMQYFRLESSDRTEKPLPRLRSVARSILTIYLGATLGATVSYSAAGMDIFDAVNHAMTTVSTGGFSTRDSSMGAFDGVAVLWVSTAFMILGGLPFSYLIALALRGRKAQTDPQVLPFLAIIAVATLLLTLVRAGTTTSGLREVSEDLFNVVSVLTTTGYAAGDYQLWGPAAVALFFALTFFGGCAGSTAGGLKVYRLMVLFEVLRGAIKQSSYPRAVVTVRYGGQQIPQGIYRSAISMVAAFLGVTAIGVFLVAATGVDFLTALSGVVTALANVGPGLGDVIGPAGNYAPLPDGAKVLLSIAMLMGRLEILAVLALLTPLVWRR